MTSKLPKLALGTWLMGGTKDPDPNNDDQGDIAVIKTAIDFGITLIDTAQNYADGKCEHLVGQAIAEYPRDQIQLLTKQKRLKLSYQEVIDGCHESLECLDTQCLDYFVCHGPNQDVDMTEFFKASNELHKQGLIKNVGVSNFGVKNLEIAIKVSDVPIALNQVSFSINDSDILTTGTYDFCLRNNIPIQAYRSLVDIKKEPDSYNALTKIAAETGFTTHQVLIAYLNSYAGVNFTIRASTQEHWQQIKDATSITLSPQHIEALKKIHLSKKGSFSHFLEM